MMERTTNARGSRKRLRLLMGLLALTLVLAVGAEVAAACTRTSLGGSKRQCTLTENFGQCLRDADDAYWQCRRKRPGFFGAARCSLAYNIDVASCVFESGAFAVLKGARGGFGG